jgi:hypothetical protein
MRTGFNKLGFKTDEFYPVVVCPPDMAELTCTQTRPEPEDFGAADSDPMLVFRDPNATVATAMRTSLFAKSLTFHYDLPASNQ